MGILRRPRGRVLNLGRQTHLRGEGKPLPVPGEPIIEPLETFELAGCNLVGDPGAFKTVQAINLLEQAAKQIIAFLNERNKTHTIKWQVRIGIHSGPISAGVIGKKKFSFDIFGDTVNIAARIESSGEPGKINIIQLRVFSFPQSNSQFLHH